MRVALGFSVLRFCGFGYFLDRFFGFGVQYGLRIFRNLVFGFRFPRGGRGGRVRLHVRYSEARNIARVSLSMPPRS